MEILDSRLHEITERARKQPKKETQQLGIVLTITRHAAIKTYCKKQNIRIVDFFNSMLDELGFPK